MVAYVLWFHAARCASLLTFPKEKNYLEYVYRYPRFLTTCLYTGYVVLLGWASGNSVMFGYVPRWSLTCAALR